MYKDRNTLIVQVDDIDSIIKICVKQLSNQNEVYFTTNVIEYNVKGKSIK